MRLRLVARVLSLVSLVVSLFMIFPMILSVIDGGVDLHAFASSLACGLTISFALFRAGAERTDYEELGIREAFAVVGLSWVIATAVGALPYVLTDVLGSYTDAFFETMSGFTTTGSTVITDIEAASRPLLLWRAMTHWLGGMGIIVLSLAVLPFLGVGGMELYKAEVPGPTPEKLTPRVQQTALFLWFVYMLLTFLETVFLMLGGVDFFDALAHAFSTISTGGFSTKNTSVAWFGSAWVEWVITFFMVASGVNFSLHFLFLTGFWRRAGRDDEFRAYLWLFVGVTAVIAVVLWTGEFYPGPEHSVRAAAFQVASFMTTTGFVSENYILWPYFTQFLLLLMAFIGSCAGSTGGGLKVVRLLVLGRTIRVVCGNLLHPRAVLHTRVNGVVVSPQARDGVLAFFTLYMGILTAASLSVTVLGDDRLDVPTALSGVIASLANLGPGLGKFGGIENYAWLPAGVKWVLCFCMLAGRLELYAVILLFLPGTWKR
ncbi:MAG: TrkH family potassium uptake protein [Synergistaceae bacterium]|nr:TrkH family potassium uptake protein [Synergistaceae bacterium]